jgi:hypothetical protein
MITDEQLRNSPPHGRLVRFLTWFVPKLKPVLWPVWLLTRNTAGGKLAEAKHLRGEGEFREAWTTAAETARLLGTQALVRQRSLLWWQEVRRFLWWQLVTEAAECVPELGAEERAELEEFLRAAPEPGGVMAAQSYAALSRARWKAADQDGAIEAARLAVDADATWAQGHILLGWYGLTTRRFDPVPHLHAAITADPPVLRYIRGIPEFAAEPGLLDTLLT